MKWSEQAWNAAKPIYDKILELPFIKELMNGKLTKEQFIFYIKQDAIYLAEYGKILTGIASRLDNANHIAAFIEFASDSINVEQALHESFMHEIKDGNSEASPTCLLYTSFLHKQLANAPIEVALAAVLPCFWIYKEVSDYILTHQVEGDNPYQSWINTYGGEDFDRSVFTAISICDAVAAQCTESQQQAMIGAFSISSKLEWMFWDSAYKQEKWTI